MNQFFMYSRKVHFYETDKMGVVHHTNYLRYFEEARVAWHNQEHITHLPIWGQAVMAVLETKVEHKRPLRFNEEFEVQMQTKNQGTLFFYEYKIFSRSKTTDQTKELAAQGSTKHVLLSPELKACKPPRDLLNVMEKESWTETWL